MADTHDVMVGAFQAERLTPYDFQTAFEGLEWALGDAEEKKPSLDVVCVALAQLYLEGGRLQRVHNHNPANIKRAPSDPENYTAFECNELLIRNGKPTLVYFSPRGELDRKGGTVVRDPYEAEPWHPQTRFAANPSTARGFQHYVEFLKRQRYLIPYTSLWQGNPAAFSKTLHAAGFYTAPEEAYTKTLVALFNELHAKKQGLPHEEVPLPGSYWDWLELVASVKGAALDRLHEIDDIVRGERNSEIAGEDG